MLIALAIIPIILCLFAFKFTLLFFRLPFPMASFFDIFPSSNRHQQLMAWTKMHGQFFVTINGFFRLNFVSSDPSILKEVFSREKFAHFAERKDGTKMPPNIRHIFVANGARWRELRKKTSTLFSSKKLCSMEPMMADSILDMLEAMASKGDAPFDFMECSNLLFAAFLSRIAFLTAFPKGDLTEFPRKYVKRAEELLKEKEKTKLAKWNWKNPFGWKMPKKVDVFGKIYGEMIGEMGEGGKMEGERVEAEMGRILLNGRMKAVGIETITFALACAVHFLSARPPLQAQIRAKIDSFSDALPLLKATIQETLRLCPIVSFANSRLCTSPIVLSNGIKIDKMDTFEADIFSLGREPKFWGPNANEFQPDRWLTNSSDHSFPFFAFGMGFRDCIGRPLALNFLEMALFKICCRFKFVSLENEDEPILEGNDVLKPIHVKIRIQEEMRK